MGEEGIEEREFYPKDPPWFRTWMIPILVASIFGFLGIIGIYHRCRSCRQREKSPSIHPITDSP
ncbi:uncharacterized protein LOC110812847 [Carica papaya]|uniref:uncharacterized protein LOC110812847 n=1 Tax=Carica papaya TaxID=3649 RepID=UPI000B8CB7B1|nr:uncharacterized protein LOC110812847 [Carica papaya]